MPIPLLRSLFKRRQARPATAQELWSQADRAHASGDHAGARAIYQGLASAERTSPEAHLYAALAEHRLNQPDRAIASLEAALTVFPQADPLVDQFVRLCADLDQMPRVVRWMANHGHATEQAACAALFGRYDDSAVQAHLLAYCLHSGFTELAEQRLRQLLAQSEDNVLLWRLADVLLLHGRQPDARRIYQRLVTRPVQEPLNVIHVGLAAYRLGDVAGAADEFEAGIARFPEAAELVEHFALICAELDAMDRLIRLAAPQAATPEEACRLMFERFASPQVQVGLISHALAAGLVDLANGHIERITSGSDDVHELWALAEMLVVKGRMAEAHDIHRRLIARAPRQIDDFHLAGLAYLYLDDSLGCLDRLEQGLLAFPDAGKLIALYTQVCAKKFDYARYRAFLSAPAAVRLPAPSSLLDFFRASMSKPVEFVIDFQEIERQLPPDDFTVLKQDFVASLRQEKHAFLVAKVVVFFCGYLHLPEAFHREVFEALRDAHAPDSKERYALQILYELTPPMIPRVPVDAQAIVERFADAAERLAQAPVPSVDPIVELTNNWTPWQYIFCLVAPKSYGRAMAAFEKLVFAAWPQLNFKAPHIEHALRPDRPASEKLRVGWMVHDSMPMMSGFLPHLDPQRFESIYLRPGNAGRSAAAKSWIERAGKTVQYADDDMPAAVEAIAAEGLDIIIAGPSIAAVFYPMMARLAPLQMVLLEPNWTDGLSHADYYISWRAAEPPDPSAFYRTPVALFQNPPYWIERPEVLRDGLITAEQRAAIRQRLLNTGPDTRVYLCANTPPKIHPDMDDLFRQILARDPQAVLVLLRAEYPPSKSLRARLRGVLGADFERVIFIPTVPKDDAHQLLQAVDCCLDSYPLCGMSSSFDGTMLGIPTVTLPSHIPFGNWTAAIYEYIGFEGLTASSRDDYVDKALRLAADAAWRARIGAEMREKSARLFDNAARAEELQAFLLQAWARKVAGDPAGHCIEGRWA